MLIQKNTLIVWICLIFIQLHSTSCYENETTVDCVPFNPSLRRIRGLKYFKEGNSKYPLLFWHVQKSGGTTFCNLLKKIYPTQGKYQSPWLYRQNCKGQWRNIIHGYQFDKVYNYHNISTDQLPDIQLYKHRHNSNINSTHSYSRVRWKYMSIEPADEFKKSWPGSYHKIPRIQNILNATNRESLIEWNEIVQVLLIRNPIERAISSFNYQYFGWKSSTLQSCNNKNITIDDCFHKAFHFMKTGHVEQELWSAAQVYNIQNQVLDNFLMHHLTIDGNTKTAIENLNMFSVIIDLSYTQHCVDILNCMFDLNLRKTDLEIKDNAARTTSTATLLSLISNKTKDTIESYLSEDIQIYKNALERMKLYHKNYVCQHECKK